MNAYIGRDIKPAGELHSARRAPTTRRTNPVTTRARPRTDRATILFIAVNDAQRNLKLDEEYRAIDMGINRQRDRFELVSKWAVRCDELEDGLLEYTPDVVHFSGHGNQRGELALHSDAGELSTISPDALRSLFATLRDNIRLVVLNACFSAEQAAAICDSVGIAIGMRRAISDHAAIAFSGALYKALAHRQSVQRAFELGCTAVRTWGLVDEADIPELLVRADLNASETHVITSPATTATQRARGARSLLRTRRAYVVASLSSIAAAAALGTVLQRPSDHTAEFSVKVLFVDDTRLPVKVTGKARLEIGSYTRAALVENSDLVEFDALPTRLADDDASLMLESHAFRLAAPARRYRVQAGSILYVDLQPIVTKLSGTVAFKSSRIAVGRITIAGHDCSGTIRDGFFEVPCAELRPPVKVHVTVPEPEARKICLREFVVQELVNNELVLGECPPAPPLCPRSAEQLIRREAALVQQNSIAVVGLFAPDATISDAQTGVSRSPTARYRAEFDRHRFTAASHADIAYIGARGSVWRYTSSSAGKFIDGTGYVNPPRSDHWELERSGECWRIRRLIINAADQPFGF